jgi:cyanate permease
VAGALGATWLRQGPQWLGEVAAVLAGAVLPLAIGRAVGGPIGALHLAVGVGAAVVAFAMIRVQGRWEGWRLALPFLAVLVLISVIV